MLEKTTSKIIVEKELGIPPDYQYRAIRSKFFVQANWHRNKLESIASFIKPKTRILDLGTGSGNFEFEFADKVSEIVGVDYNPEALAFLKEKLKEKNIKNVKLFLSDIRNLSKSGVMGKFDMIVAIDVIEHIGVSDAKKVVQYLKRLLKPSGKICIITPNYKSTWLVMESILDMLRLVPKMHGEQHLAKYYKENLVKLFEDEGLKAESISAFNLFSFMFCPAALAKKLCRLEIKSGIGYGNLVLGVFSVK
jgi:2-polyprenyl-3-methyl-5-hydroxy-6-metoxy-1,4-benzoquinol methylase